MIWTGQHCRRLWTSYLCGLNNCSYSSMWTSARLYTLEGREIYRQHMSTTIQTTNEDKDLEIWI